MKLHKYTDDPLYKRLSTLSEAATPGPWKLEPKRLYVDGQPGPIMSYLVGDQASPDGMKVSLASERHADHALVAELVNAWRAGMLYVQMKDYDL